MKKFMRYLGAVLSLAVLLGLFVACGEQPRTESELKSNTIYDADGFETVSPDQNTDESNEDSRSDESSTEPSGDTTEGENTTDESVDLPKIPI